MSSQSNCPLLVVEDSNEDFKMLQRLMRRMEVQNPIYRCTSGDDALEFLADAQTSGNTPRPSVILLDLNLPGIDGRNVLEQLKQNQDLKEIPIVIFTTSSNPQDITFCYRQGANGYLIKPMDADELKKTVQAFVEFWLESNTPPSKERPFVV
ncbi:MAG: response regulator [Leptolyngbya sp. Prado105]|jgi:CheY-like chemotaxis protein|nr:response regulator [Leptolyngbya sp. Prado105]